MATWSEFAQQAPELAAVAAQLWPGISALDCDAPRPRGRPWFDIAYLATVRRDGAPRLHPFCPILSGGRLFAAIPPRSPKGDDLRRDPRCVIHATPGPDDAELCVRCEAREVTDGAARTTLIATVERSGVSGMVKTVTEHPIFEFDVVRVDAGRWVNVGQADTYAERAIWREQ